MKKLRFVTLAAFLLFTGLGIQFPAHSAGQTKTATINGRIFFGKGLTNLQIPCKAIIVTARPKEKAPIVQAATGPLMDLKSGECTFSIKNVPPGVPVELKAKFQDYVSSPEDTYPAPAGKWTNPLILKPGQIVTKYVKLSLKS